tara:strand:+ start:2781 stop:3332 length:552 start_codon:yes stop_codon:yes gene_type:complete
MKKILILCFLGIALWACNNSKKVKAETVEQEAADTHLQEPEPESKHLLERSQSKLSDSLFARIQRTACFGRCPIYTLSVYESGYVEYRGEKWVEREGLFYAFVDQKKLNELLQAAKDAQYFEMEHAYDNKNVTDLPSTITTVKGETGFHIVVNRINAPEELNNFANRFDEIFKDLEWKEKPIE